MMGTMITRRIEYLKYQIAHDKKDEINKGLCILSTID
jgi:hypothetical protein